MPLCAKILEEKMWQISYFSNLSLKMTSFKGSFQAFQPEIVKATHCSGSFHRSSFLVEHLAMIAAVAILIKTMVTNHPINPH